MHYCASRGVKIPAIEVESLKNDLLGCVHKNLHKVTSQQDPSTHDLSNYNIFRLATWKVGIVAAP